MGFLNGNVLRRPHLSLRREWHTLLAATIGTLLTCFAVVALTVPYQFAGGGVLGLALISNYAWGISPAWVLSVGNAVLLLWGWKALSLRFALWTLYVTVLTSVAIPVFELFQYPVIGNTILAALLAGAVGGVGFGMLFRVGASSGGTDVIVMVARKRWGVDIGSMSFYINVVILFASFVVVDIEKILMGGLLLYVETVTIDRVLKSFDRRSQVLIISKRTQDIADFILNELDRFLGDDELLIATNNHVVEGATTLSVCFIGSDVVSAEQETENYINGNGDLNIDGAVSAKIKGTDEDTDLAVIAVEKSDIPEETMSQIKIAQLGNSDDLAVGEQVVAIGNALGYGQTVTSGWVSALDRTVQSDSNTYEELIQTDAAINPGNSGGALLNMQGELIGINCAKIASSSIEGTGYAIPISKAQPILEELMNRKTRDKVSDESQIGYLGVKFADLSREAIQMYNMPSGAFVMDVYPGEAADNAGIQKSDIITKLDGQKVSSKADINDKLQYYSAGEEIEIEVARLNNGEYEESTVTVTLSARPDGNQ